MEVDSSALSPKKCKTYRGHSFFENEYIVGANALDEENVKAILRLNGFIMNLRYYKHKISQYGIDRMSNGLVSIHYNNIFFIIWLFLFLTCCWLIHLYYAQILERKRKNLGLTWTNRDQVLQIVGDIKWEIQIEWNGYLYSLGNGWSKFSRDTGVEARDMIIFWTYESKVHIYACIFKKRDNVRAKYNSGIISHSKRLC